MKSVLANRISVVLSLCCWVGIAILASELVAQDELPKYEYDERQKENWAEVDRWIETADISDEQIAAIEKLRILGTEIRIGDEGIAKVRPLGGYACSVVTTRIKGKVVERKLVDLSERSRWDDNHSSLRQLNLFPSIGRLSLLSLNLDSEEWRMIGDLKAVESLDIRLPGNSPLVLSDAIESLANLSQLKSLWIQAEVVEFETDTLNPLSALTQLESFSIDCDQATAAHFEFLKSTTNLTRIRLSSPLIDDQLVDKISKLEDLEDLGLAGTAVGDALVKSLGSMTKLESLDLSKTKITDACLPFIQIPALDDQSPVGSLKFVGTAITAEGILSIPKATLQNTFLISLPEVDRKDVLPIFLIQPKLFVTYTETITSGVAELTNSNELVPTKEEMEQLRAELAEEESDSSLIKNAVARLIEIQEDDGAWPYEGVYRVRRKIPVGYRVGGTAIVCTSLLYAGETEESEAALQRGIDLILKELDHPLMKPDTTDRYDVRVWGHIYALDFFCRLHLHVGSMETKEKTDPWIPKLVEILVEEQIDDGGWNYASQSRHASFVTAPAVQALLLAKQTGEQIEDDVFAKARWVLENSRTEKGAYQYSGTNGRREAAVPGSIARSPICETTQLLLGGGDLDAMKAAMNDFYTHWGELEKRRKKTGTHEPPYGIAPYYFYYGHRYIGQAIRKLPASEKAAAREKFRDVLLKTKDEDGTWNDRVFDRSKAYGTAMSILALNNDVPLPESIEIEAKPPK